MLRNPFFGGVFVPAAAMLFLAGCDDASRVERRELSEPRKIVADHDARDVRPSSTPESPHGMPMSPHGEGDSPQENWKNPAEVDLGQVHFTAPKVWLRKPRKSEFVMAEFALPRAEGDPADGRLTITSAGGTVEDNLNRWRGQFVGKPEKDTQDSLDVSGNKATLVDFSGTYVVQNMAMGESTKAPNYRMLGAIVDVGGQLYFVKAYGPAKTMATRADEFRAFVKSLKVGG